MSRSIYRTLFHIFGLLLVAILFILVSRYAEQHQELLKEFVDYGGVYGVVAFIFITALFVIFVVPLDIVLLIPLGVAAWGPIPTALMSILGWTIGASVAFGIGRILGLPFVSRFLGPERIASLEKRIPKKNLFGVVVFLRMLVSVDVLSYALGIFSTMPWGLYILATAIGVAPFAFYFAFMGTLSFWYQLIAVTAVLLLATGTFIRYGR